MRCVINAVGTGGKIVQMIESVIMVLARHKRILQLEAAHMPQTGMYAPPTIFKTEGMTEDTSGAYSLVEDSQ